MKWFWWNASRGDVSGVLSVLAVIGVPVFALTRGADMRHDVDASFGSDRECTPQPMGGPTCIKKPAR